MRLLYALMAGSVLSAGACNLQGLPAEPMARGKMLFTNCVACHGDDGMGKTLVSAPAIAGLPSWYVTNQLTKFRSGLRGAHPDDVEGMKMRPMALVLREEADITAVGVYVQSMPRPRVKATLAKGNHVVGQLLYRTCVACHGPTGAGNEAMKAPPLAGMEDWYLSAQLHKFRDGRRGASPTDPQGMLMRPQAMALADEDAINHVLAYISTLER